MYTETNTLQTEEHLFTEQDVLNYEDASLGKRFLNFLIDCILVQYALAFVGGIVLGLSLTAISPEVAARFLGDQNALGFLVISYLMVLVNDLLYFTLCEKLFKGYTLGKLITGTRALRTDGAELTWKDALLRSLCRMVPFEPFSAFGQSPWHDSWTKTMVIRAR